jgi:UDP-glucose 4-epimerase
VRVLDTAAPPSRASAWAGVDVRQGSVADGAALRRALEGIDTVFHLAAIVGVRRVAEDPRGVLAANVAGARAVVDACQEVDARLLFVSSSEIYGSGARGARFSESDAPGFDARRVGADGRAAYAESKRLGEEMCLTAAGRGLRVAVVRPFNGVGAGQRPESGALVPSLLECAFAGRPIFLEGAGAPTRAFTDAEEMARAFYEIATSPRAQGRIVNVGGAAVHSLRQVAELVLARTGSRSPIADAGPSLVANVAAVSHRAPDLTLLRQVLGWAPSRPLAYSVDRAAAAAAARVEPAAAAG